MKSFVDYQPEQLLMLPPSLEDWMPEDHLAHFIAEVTRELDLSEIFRSYEGDARGQSAYHPLMMLRLLLYGYCRGVVSSREIERRTYEDVAFRYLACNQHPDHSTLAEFRRRHRESLEHLFVNVLRLCREAGLVKLGHVALDGTKIKANASLEASRSYASLVEQEQHLAEQVEGMLAEAERMDAAEDAKHGRERRGDELPEGFRKQQGRLKKLREAKARLQQQARDKAAQEQAAKEKAAQEKAAKEKEKKAKVESAPVPAEEAETKPEAAPAAEPEPKDRINLTDADSQMMKDRSNGGWVQGYNVQAAVDGHAQIIVAAEVTQDQNDRSHLCPLLAQVEQNLGSLPEKVSADTDYWSPKQVCQPILEGVDLYVRPEDPPPKIREAEQSGAGGLPLRKRKPRSGYTEEGVSRADAMRVKLKTPEGRAIYAARRGIIEPVFGQIKGRGLRQFVLRGLERVGAEWKLICLTHNLLKLYRYGWLPSRAG